MGGRRVLETYSTLATIGALEAVVYLVRYRTAHACGPGAIWRSALSSLAVCVMRLAFALTGATIVVDGGGPLEVALAMLSYAGSASICTAAAHAWLNRRRERGAA